MKKRQHHHVWRHYLKPWTQSGALFCLSGGRIFTTGTTVVVVEKDFYRLLALSETVATFALRPTSQDTHPLARTANEQFLESVLAPLHCVRMFDDRLSVPVIDQVLDEYRSNVLEDYHAAAEARFMPFLAQMQGGDTGFFANGTGAIEFINFICLQYLRTKPIKERSLASPAFVVLTDQRGVDLSKAWDLIAIMLANNVGGNLYLELKARTLTRQREGPT